MKMILGLAAACLLTTVSTVATAATTYTFITNLGTITSSSGSGATNSYVFTSTAGGATATITGYQASQSAGTIARAALGAYSPGLGVVGQGDGDGSSNLHQLDNAGGYTDFVQIVFDRAVTLNSVGLTSYFLPGTNVIDNDLSFLALSSALSGSVNPAGWTDIAGAGGHSSGLTATALTGSSAASRYWLVGAAMGTSSGFNDGFKISSLNVTAAVPEPSTWAMMLVGFGAIGVAGRSGRSKFIRAVA